MAVNLFEPAVLHPVPGIRLGTAAAGIRKKNRDDLLLIACAEGTTAAAVFTRNRFCAAPVAVAKRHLAVSSPRALLINSGCANAGTGRPGERDALTCCAAVADLLPVRAREVLPFSTGVIGMRLPADKIAAALPDCVAACAEDNWLRAARAIMTTDTLPKGATRRVRIGGRTITITGIAKGAGMIRPDMATLLSFIATDARLPRPLLARCLRQAVDQSFNRITVDGDTSTNDACVLLASGRADIPALRAGSREYARFETAVGEVMTDLAQAIIRDAEGATKFVTVEVTGGATEGDCLKAAYAVAQSPLVKTALFASDPNWGRILAAVGRAGVARLPQEKLMLEINGARIVTRGGVDPRYTEAQGVAAMAPAEIHIRIGLGMGRARAAIWTSDLSHDYVKINAEYRT